MLKDPFSAEKEATLYVARPACERAIDALVQALLEGPRLAALIGPAGIGKSMILAVLEERLRDDACCISLASNGMACAELCSWVLREFDARETRETERALSRTTLARFRDFMQREKAYADRQDPEQAMLELAADLRGRGYPLVVLIDDADQLKADAAHRLGELVSQAGGGLAIAVVLPDRADGAALLSAFGRELDTVHFDAPLSLEETTSYLRERLTKARASDELLECLDEGRVRRIYRYTDGNPRRVHGEIGLIHLELSRVRAGIGRPSGRSASVRGPAVAFHVPPPSPVSSPPSAPTPGVRPLVSVPDPVVGREPEPEAEPIQPQPVEPRSVEPAPVQPRSVAVEPVAVEPVEVEPAQRRSVAVEPVEARPIEPAPVEVEPVEFRSVEVEAVEAVEVEGVEVRTGSEALEPTPLDDEIEAAFAEVVLEPAPVAADEARSLGSAVASRAPEPSEPEVETDEPEIPEVRTATRSPETRRATAAPRSADAVSAAKASPSAPSKAEESAARETSPPHASESPVAPAPEPGSMPTPAPMRVRDTAPTPAPRPRAPEPPAPAVQEPSRSTAGAPETLQPSPRDPVVARELRPTDVPPARPLDPKPAPREVTGDPKTGSAQPLSASSEASAGPVPDRDAAERPQPRPDTPVPAFSETREPGKGQPASGRKAAAPRRRRPVGRGLAAAIAIGATYAVYSLLIPRPAPDPVDPRASVSAPAPSGRATAPAVDPDPGVVPPAAERARPEDVAGPAERAPAPPAPPIVYTNVQARPWANISVDGKDIGETPLADVPIPEGYHEFRARMPDGREIVRTEFVSEDNRRILFE